MRARPKVSPLALLELPRKLVECAMLNRRPSMSRLHAASARIRGGEYRPTFERSALCLKPLSTAGWSHPEMSERSSRGLAAFYDAFLRVIPSFAIRLSSVVGFSP